MRTLLLMLMLFAARFAIAAPLPDGLVGIWSTAGSEFRGDALFKGNAIYLDSDGVGAYVGGTDASVLGMRIVVTSFDPETHILDFYITDQGQAGPRSTLVYDPTARVLISEREGYKFELRKAGPLAAQMRKVLGLEQKQAP